MSENQSQPTIIVERGGSGLGAFLLGAIAGAVTALLFAPKTGEETQRELREGARKLRRDAEEKIADLRDTVEEGAQRVRGDVSQRVESAREEVRDRKRQAEEALKAGKEAARQARGDLEKRVSESKAAYKSALGESEEEADAEAS